MVNYQGVLRDQNDKPLSGSYDMTFRFMDAASGGNEILIDQHAASSANAVSVSGGLFNVALGSGTVTDGAGPGAYISLDQVFRDYAGVWLEVKIGAETLAPRTRVQAAAYALNATNATAAANASQLGGFPSSNFLDVTSTYQTKSGPLRLTSADPSIAVVSVACSGTSMGYRSDSCGDYGAYLSSPGTGVLGAGGYYGVRGYGTVGGYFDNAGHNVFLAGDGPDGAGGAAYGDTRGLYFSSSGETYGDVGFFDGSKYYGVWAHGYYTGGYFENTYSGTHTWLDDSDGSSVKGNGSKNFVQSHPLHDDRAIVYAALEGDEVGTYTRGSATLRNGEARVVLGETFQYVTNPELGLTVSVTPKGAPSRLYVAETSTTELLVKTAPGDPDVDFDYVVTGLRIGFEHANVVREKEAPEPVPELVALEEQQRRHPELGRTTPLARFEGMERASGRAPKSSYPKAQALLAQIRAADHGVSESPAAAAARLPGLDIRRSAEAGPQHASELTAVSTSRAATPATAEKSATEPAAATQVQASLVVLATSEPVDAGDLLALDPLAPGKLHRATSVMDPSVVGVAAEASVVAGAATTVGLSTAFLATVKADAGFGAIRPGDLLVSSTTPGHVMASASPRAGTIVGKALEGLESGMGSIRVLLTLR
jgi:hypothetical protein